MRQKYFNLIQDIDYSCICYQKYYSKALTIERVVNALCACVSAVGIAGWAIWKEYPLAWSIIIAVSQTVTVIFPYTPYKKRRIALDYLIPRLRALKIEVDKIWHQHCDEPDYNFSNDYIHFLTEYQKTDSEFLGAEEIPISRRLQKKAQQELNYDITGQYTVNEVN